MTIRPSTYDDIPSLELLFSLARAQMAADGNPTQWGDGYPEREQLVDDIEQGYSYVVEHERTICATFVFIIGKDPTYAYIEGKWIDDSQRYATIHRIASNGRQTGIFHKVLEWCTQQCANIRIDTHKDNTRMIHLIEKEGFNPCGIIYTRNHSPRVAYQRIK